MNDRPPGRRERRGRERASEVKNYWNRSTSSYSVDKQYLLSKGRIPCVPSVRNDNRNNQIIKIITTRHAGVVGLWGAPHHQRSPCNSKSSSTNSNCWNGASGVLHSRTNTTMTTSVPIVAEVSSIASLRHKQIKSPSSIMRQSSLTKLGSMINTAVNKRAGKFYSFQPIAHRLKIIRCRSMLLLYPVCTLGMNCHFCRRTHLPLSCVKAFHRLLTHCKRNSLIQLLKSIPGDLKYSWQLCSMV